MHKYVTSNKFNMNVMRRAKAILTEGKQMTQVMKNAGLNNVYYTPNFKNISYLPQKTHILKHGDTVHFVFFARITPYKGTNLIFEAIQQLKDKGYGKRMKVHFYGMMLDSYRDEFMSKIANNKDIAFYHGVLNGMKKETYDELAQYNVMLFPTFWNDEGFPASLVDGFIAGLPVIASDWNQNKEIVHDNENGFLIEVRNSEALAQKMLYMLDNTDFINSRIKSIQQSALQFDTYHVLNRDFLKQIELI